jgi:hypothetical protein
MHQDNLFIVFCFYILNTYIEFFYRDRSTSNLNVSVLPFSMLLINPTETLSFLVILEVEYPLAFLYFFTSFQSLYKVYSQW